MADQQASSTQEANMGTTGEGQSLPQDQQQDVRQNAAQMDQSGNRSAPDVNKGLVAVVGAFAAMGVGVGAAIVAVLTQAGSREATIIGSSIISTGIVTGFILAPVIGSIFAVFRAISTAPGARARAPVSVGLESGIGSAIFIAAIIAAVTYGADTALTLEGFARPAVIVAGVTGVVAAATSALLNQ